jgi:signal peptidase
MTSLRVRVASGRALALLGWAGLGLLVLLTVLPLVGITPRPVLSGSMEPSIATGGLVLTRQVDPSSIVVGDVVTYRSGEDLVTHRVVGDAVDGDHTMLQTRGDATESADPPVRRSDVVGRAVLDLPFLGRLLLTFGSGFGFLLGLAAPLLLILLGNVLARQRDSATSRDSDLAVAT